MDNKKGICINCEDNENCTFPRKNPVWDCEEFKVDDTIGRNGVIHNTEEKQTN